MFLHSENIKNEAGQFRKSASRLKTKQQTQKYKVSGICFQSTTQNLTDSLSLSLSLSFFLSFIHTHTLICIHTLHQLICILIAIILAIILVIVIASKLIIGAY